MNFTFNQTAANYGQYILSSSEQAAGFCNISQSCLNNMVRELNEQLWGKQELFISCVIIAVFFQALVDILRKRKLEEKKPALFLILYLLNYGVGLFITVWSLTIWFLLFASK